MKKFRKSMIILMSVLIIFAVGCGKKEPEEKVLDMGTIEGNKYINEFFGLEIDFPEEWFISNQTKIDRVNKRDFEKITLFDEEREEKYKELSERRNLLYFEAYKYEGVHDSENPLVQVASAKLSFYEEEEIIDAESYLEKSKSLYQENPYGETGEVEEKSINGVVWKTLKFKMTFPGDKTIEVENYCIKIDEHLVYIVVSYTDEDEKKEVEENIINSLKIDKKDK